MHGPENKSLLWNMEFWVKAQEQMMVGKSETASVVKLMVLYHVNFFLLITVPWLDEMLAAGKAH